MFCHTGGIISWIIIIVEVQESTFRESQVAELHSKLVIMRVLDKCAIVNSGRICRFAISFQLYRCRPFFVKLNINVQIESRSVAMALLIVINHIARVGVKFYFARELDFRAFRCGFSFLSKRRNGKDRCSSKAKQEVGC